MIENFEDKAKEISSQIFDLFESEGLSHWERVLILEQCRSFEDIAFLAEINESLKRDKENENIEE